MEISRPHADPSRVSAMDVTDTALRSDDDVQRNAGETVFFPARDALEGVSARSAMRRSCPGDRNHEAP
jgi:hypothetical protein